MTKSEKIKFALKERFSNEDLISRDELYDLIQLYYSELKNSTFLWRIFELKKAKIIISVKKGYYKLLSKNTYKPKVDSSLRKINNKIKADFPYISFCLWNSNWINEFSRHQVSKNIIFIEVEKDLMQSVYYKLANQKFNNLYLNPDKSVFDLYVLENTNSIVIKPLITKSPCQKIDGVTTVKIEKVLVDVFCENIYLSAFQGNEILTVFETILSRYEINFATLLNYSRRREQEKKLKNFLLQNFNHLKDLL